MRPRLALWQRGHRAGALGRIRKSARAGARRRSTWWQDARAPEVTPIGLVVGGRVGAGADRNSAMLSVRILENGSRFSWTVYGPANEMLGRGTAETEHKARIDAFRASMTYIDRLKPIYD